MVVCETDISNSGVVRLKCFICKMLFDSFYGIRCSVLENSTLLKREIQVENLTEEVKAINTKIVSKVGKTTILAAKLSNKEVLLRIIIKDSNYNYVHNTMAFNIISEEIEISINMHPLSLKQQGSGRVNLPPLLINTIDLSDLSVPINVNAFQSAIGLKVIPKHSYGEFNIELGENKADIYNLYSLNGKRIANGRFFCSN